VRLIKRLTQLLAGANSKAEQRTEQSEWSRKSTRTFEVMVETDEIIVYQAGSIPPHNNAKGFKTAEPVIKNGDDPQPL